MNVGFFLDAAEFFIAQGERALGLRILSNLAEMDLQNRQVLRLLAYRLQQAGEVANALPLFERVLELAPNEPQSHRDLGLALAEAGQAQKAVDRLYEVVTGRWDGRFPDIDLIALAELNGVVAKAAREGKPLDVAAIEPRLLKNLPLDVRVVLAWDADATDVDLHVIDPNGDEVYYGRNLSWQGGMISRDATGGYGPEEFALKVAKPGKYRVEANFYGHRQQVLTSSTGLMLWLSSGFATAGQQDKRTTLRLKSQGGQRVLVGEFEVKAEPHPALSRQRRGRVVGLSRCRRALGRRRGGAAGWRLPRLGGELRRHRLDLVLAHVVVHVAPAGEDRRAVGLPVDRVAVLDRPAGVAAGAADRPAVGFARGGDLLGRFDAEHVAAAEQAGGDEKGGAEKGGGAHGRTKGFVRNIGRPAADLRRAPGQARRIAPGIAAIASSRSTRSSVVGWVENRLFRPPPCSGLMIIICAVAGLRSAVGSGVPRA